MNTESSYKPHIDGLRTIAVCLVVLFHINPTVFSGGYLGVDVFFVISGFVITKSLYKDYLKNGHIHIFEFYIRRFKRLYPALVTMLTLTSVTYLFFGFFWQTHLYTYLKTAFYAFFASSNLYFLYQGDNYFNQDFLNPLKHTWSLGVEEQFYLLYPLLLAFGLSAIRWFKLQISTLAGMLLIISALSYGVFISHIGDELGSFYFPFARFWELGIGCALALFSFSNNRLMSAMGFVGILMLGALQLFQSQISFVPLETLLAVVATVFIIYAGISSEGFVVRLLSKPSMVYVGKLSYSLYLWHLPVLYFAYLYIDTGLLIVVVPAISFLFAVASFHLVENPLRYSKVFDKCVRQILKPIPIASFLLLGFILVIFVLTTTFHFGGLRRSIGDINYLDQKFDLNNRIETDYLYMWNEITNCSSTFEVSLSLRTFEPPRKCIKSSNQDQPLFYIIGDSHALHLVPMFYMSDLIQNLYYRQSYEFFPVESEDADKSQSLEKTVAELQALSTKFSHIYFVVSLYFAGREEDIESIEYNLRTYIESVESFGTVILVTPTPVFDEGPQRCMIQNRDCVLSGSQDRKRQHLSIEMFERLSGDYKNVLLFDLYPALCANTQCHIYIPESDTMVYRDTNHISVEQSKLLAPALDTWLRSTFVSLP